jgi:hypothetical protein
MGWDEWMERGEASSGEEASGGHTSSSASILLNCVFSSVLPPALSSLSSPICKEQGVGGCRDWVVVRGGFCTCVCGGKCVCGGGRGLSGRIRTSVVASIIRDDGEGDTIMCSQ